MRSLSDDLVEFAARTLEANRGNYNRAAIRRAVSSAYYAVFHRLCELCADALVGRGKSGDAYVAIYRSLDHAPVKNTLDQMKGQDKDLLRICDGYRELQEARYWADYDPSPRRAGDSTESFAPDKAIELVERARDIVSALGALDEDRRLSLAAQLVGKARGKARQGL